MDSSSRATECLTEKAVLRAYFKGERGRRGGDVHGNARGKEG